MTVVTPGGFTVSGIVTGTKVGFSEADALAGPALLEHSVDLLLPATVGGF